MRFFNVLLDGRVKPGHDNGGRFGRYAMLLVIRTINNDPGIFSNRLVNLSQARFDQ